MKVFWWDLPQTATKGLSKIIEVFGIFLVTRIIDIKSSRNHESK